MKAGISTFGQAQLQINRIKVQQGTIDTLSQQLSSGKKTQVFSGLSTQILPSQRARAQFESLGKYTDNINIAQRRVSMMQNAIESFKDHAREFQTLLNGLSRESTHQKGEIVYYDDPATGNTVENIALGHTSADPDIDLNALTDYADSIHTLLIDLMNTKDGDRYLLAGADSATKPITDTGTLDAAIGTLITNWKDESLSTTDMIADLRDRTTATNPNAITDSTVGYSTTLSTGQAGDVFVRASETLEIKYTQTSLDRSFRDVMVAVSYIKNENLGPIADTFIPPNVGTPGATPDVQGAPGDTLDDQKENFYAVLNVLGSMIDQAVDDLDNQLFELSTVQARLQQIENDTAEEKNLLLSTISSIEDIDQNEVALQLNTTLTQIETSYAVTSRVQQLSLLNFI